MGTVTPLKQYGNKKPRVFRLENDKALINRLGFNNSGSDVVSDRIKKNKLVNRSILINSKGIITDFYDKIHMYDVTLSKKEKYFESKTFSAGKKIKVSNLPWGKLGMSICYDLRFPELFRHLSNQGVDLICMPAAFTAVTGKVKPGSKAAKRRKSFCARSAGQMKKFPKAAKDPNSRLRQARRRWKC